MQQAFGNGSSLCREGLLVQLWIWAPVEGLNQSLLGSWFHHGLGRKLGSSTELSGSSVPLGSVGPLLDKTCAIINKQTRKELILDFPKWVGSSQEASPSFKNKQQNKSRIMILLLTHIYEFIKVLQRHWKKEQGQGGKCFLQIAHSLYCAQDWNFLASKIMTVMQTCPHLSFM